MHTLTCSLSPHHHSKRVHSSVVRAADCRSAGPWFKSGCALQLCMLCTEDCCTESQHHHDGPARCCHCAYECGFCHASTGYIAQWLGRLTADQQVPGSNPGVPSSSACCAQKTAAQRANITMMAQLAAATLCFSNVAFAIPQLGT